MEVKTVLLVPPGTSRHLLAASQILRAPPTQAWFSDKGAIALVQMGRWLSIQRTAFNLPTSRIVPPTAVDATSQTHRYSMHTNSTTAAVQRVHGACIN